MDPKPYLDYLDKEMTIMGILSAFSVATSAGILVAVMGKDSPIAATIWNGGQIFILAGSIFGLVAASLFYKERSDLAWFYGRISLVQAQGADDSSLSYWLEEADAWTTWWAYFCGFLALLAGFAEYLSALLFFAVPAHWTWLGSHLHILKVVTLILIPAIAISWGALDCYVRVRYKYDEHAWSKFWATFRIK